ncbi:methylmalonyl-CoA epimerase [Rhodococcus sp. 1168]|uniref:methylmalonyl-CoA epimerase n=1 Tax=Rhodococcus sp. 1168 TaxID=2018041 RepID=UPI000A0B212D|nr:methylmalonyl-CoA epimerase [Rhodococcus sp. 1168]ORI21497.1 methylmalonyl-CoA epimerase [Rhodococcus sp. 1168]
MTSTTQSPTGAPLRSDLVSAIDHVGVAVPDLDVAIAWYTEHLGMVATHEEVNEEQGVREAMLSFPGATSASAALQLLAPLNEESTIAKFIGRSGPGLQQLAYRVTSIEEISDELRSRGVRLLYDAPRRGTADSRINFIHPKDAGGVLIELVEPSEKSVH